MHVDENVGEKALFIWSTNRVLLIKSEFVQWISLNLHFSAIVGTHLEINLFPRFQLEVNLSS